MQRPELHSNLDLHKLVVETAKKATHALRDHPDVHPLSDDVTPPLPYESNYHSDKRKG